MLISVDHGNKQMKTKNHIFTSGLYESDTVPSFGQDILKYNGKYYSIIQKRIPYMKDKTTDERFFVLTLFAIAYELEHMPEKKEIYDIFEINKAQFEFDNWLQDYLLSILVG